MLLFDPKETESSFTDEEMRQALKDIKKEFPSVHRWFFLWRVAQNRENKDALRKQTASGEAG